MHDQFKANDLPFCVI